MLILIILNQNFKIWTDFICEVELMKKILDKNVYRYVEYELFNYKYSKKELADEEIEAIYGIVEGDINAGIRGKNKKSSRTENSAIDILSTKRIVKLTKIIEDIDNAMNKLDKVYNKFFELYYKNRKGMVETCHKVPISERSFYNYKNKIVWAVAKEMGLMNYD